MDFSISRELYLTNLAFNEDKMTTIYVIKTVADRVGKEVLVTSNSCEADLKFWDLGKQRGISPDIPSNASIYYLSFKTDKDGNRIEGTMEFMSIKL